MTLSLPSDLRGIVLFWWKIVDSPQILKDKLYNFIAFELYLTTIDKAKKMVEQAIKLKFLTEDDSMEYVSLSSDLQNDLTTWQANGEKKAVKINQKLAQTWRMTEKISPNLRFTALMVEMIDPSIFEQSGKLRASQVKLESKDFEMIIKGQAKEYDEKDEEIFYPFHIDRKKNQIAHNCPDFINIRKPDRKFCVHLGRVFMKLNIDHPEKTNQLLAEIIHGKAEWTFSDAI